MLRFFRLLLLCRGESTREEEVEAKNSVRTSRRITRQVVKGAVKGGLASLIFAFVLTPTLFSQTATDPDMSGTWVENGNSASKIVFAEKGDKIQVRETDGDKVLADYSCSLSGTQCKIKEDGRDVNVMIYYNGSKLVEITERGNDVQKRRFSLSQDGKTMQMEIIPLSSAGRTITRTYQKEQDSQEAKSTL